MNNNRTYNYLKEFTLRLQKEGKYSFVLDDLRNNFPDLNDVAFKFALNRLSKKGDIVSVRRGYYVIIPPEYAAMNILPPDLFINDLMGWLNKPYYIGLLNAAAYHGAGHQQPQEFFVITDQPALRTISKRNIRINFLTKKEFPNIGLIKVKTDTGFAYYSSPGLTAIDLLYFANKIGGINRVVTVLSELSEQIEYNELKNILKQDFPGSVLQRLGYIFEKVLLKDKLSKAIAVKLRTRNIYRVPLAGRKRKAGFKIDKKWKIIVNTIIESDL